MVRLESVGRDYPEVPSELYMGDVQNHRRSEEQGNEVVDVYESVVKL